MSDPKGCACRHIERAKAPACDDLSGQVLQILRLQIQSQILPQRRGWQRGLRLASALWGAEKGPQVFAAIAAMLDEMGRARQSIFRISNPDCPGCAATMTAHETLIVQCFRLLQSGAQDKAKRCAFLLCEANPCAVFLAMTERLVTLVPAASSEPR
ncbi:hypothetical protein [Rhodobacter lacus]|uniref:Uncharacterized protein n=1 Tax=Rhodobacter lacus TaxID=1641972 RepID=A0ABW5A9L9_9RHOB